MNLHRRLTRQSKIFELLDVEAWTITYQILKDYIKCVVISFQVFIMPLDYIFEPEVQSL